jgi:lauroyl/myristoyl acyltransferase
MSVVPPGVNGTTIFTGLVGHIPWASADDAIKRVAAPAYKAWARRFFGLKGNLEYS